MFKRGILTLIVATIMAPTWARALESHNFPSFLDPILAEHFQLTAELIRLTEAPLPKDESIREVSDHRLWIQVIPKESSIKVFIGMAMLPSIQLEEVEELADELELTDFSSQDYEHRATYFVIKILEKLESPLIQNKRIETHLQKLGLSDYLKEPPRPSLWGFGPILWPLFILSLFGLALFILDLSFYVEVSFQGIKRPSPLEFFQILLLKKKNEPIRQSVGVEKCWQ